MGARREAVLSPDGPKPLDGRSVAAHGAVLLVETRRWRGPAHCRMLIELGYQVEVCGALEALALFDDG